MKVLVYDVAAEDGGGLFVLMNFFQDVSSYQNDEIEWIFMVSTDEIVESDRVKVLRFPEVKSSWCSRLKFEYFTLPKLIRATEPDLIISLQNMPIKRCKIRQFVYLHQSLQYCPKRFSLMKREERSLAIRQRFISALIKNAMPKAEQIFVQTQWIKEATVKWLDWDKNRISVVPVSINTDGIEIQDYVGANSRDFFYPARAEIYKNHGLIIEACKILQKRGVSDFRIIFTILPDDNAYAQQIVSAADGLPIQYLGSVEYQDIWNIYSRTILLFPSYLETCGLPMLEARKAGAVVLASDMPFSHEALNGYPNACFFDINDPDDLANKMEKVLIEPHCHLTDDTYNNYSKSLLCSMLERF